MLVDIPTNLLLKKIGAGKMLPILSITWGLITLLQSQVTSFGGLVTVRFFLGLVEGGLFPGMLLYLSSFYCRAELQVRITLFFAAVILSGAFSGLLAAAIQQMDGLRGLRGWQWIFLLEGLLTICCGMVGIFVLPSTPSKVLTFKKEHVDYCHHRLELDSNLFDKEHITVKAVLSIFKDSNFLIALPFYFASGSLGLGLSVFLPTIVAALGYSSTNTQLLTVPPYTMAFIAAVITSFISDRYRQRGLSAFTAGLVALAGGVILYCGRGFGVRYTGTCLLVIGTYTFAPCTLAWLPNNIAGHARRATALATLAMLTSAGGLASTWIYPTSSAPYFAFAARFNIALICIMDTCVLLLLLRLRSQNRRKEEKPSELLRGLEHLSEEEQFVVLGDHHPNYRYTY